MPHPENTNTAKMTPELVVQFLNEAWDGEKLTEKAKRYPCSAMTLGDIRARKTWRNIKPKGE